MTSGAVLAGRRNFPSPYARFVVMACLCGKDPTYSIMPAIRLPWPGVSTAARRSIRNPGASAASWRGSVASSDVRRRLVNQCIAELLLNHDAPSLNVVTDESLAAFAGQSMCLGSRKTLRRVSIAMSELGIVRRRLPDSPAPQPPARPELLGVDRAWLDWCERWKATSTRSEVYLGVRILRGVDDRWSVAGAMSSPR